MGGLLMSKASEEQGVRADTRVSVRCSCSHCNSYYCFAKGKQSLQCACEKCETPKSCLYYYTNKNVLKDHLHGTCVMSSCSEKYVPYTTEEYAQEEIDYEGDRARIIKTNKPYNTQQSKSLSEYIFRIFKRTSSHTIKENTKTLSGYIDAITGSSNLRSNQKKLETYIIDLKKSKAPKFSVMPKRPSKSLRKSEPHCKHYDRNKNVTEVRSVVCSSVEFRPAVTNARSQGTKVDHKNDVITCKSPCRTNNSNVLEVIKKLKEVYKSCSCKVCECIPTQIFRENICNCKPCECVECTKYMTIEKKRKPYTLYHGNGRSCTCSQFYSKCKIHAPKQQKECSCKHCEYRKRKSGKSCNCKPCECIQCKSQITSSLKTMVVRPVIMNYKHTACQSLPCEYIECRHDNISTTMSVNELKGSYKYKNYLINTYGDIAARSFEKRDNFISKTVDGKTHEFDTQTNAIIKDVYQSSDGTKGSNNISMLAMYATLPTYTNYDSSNTNTNTKFWKSQGCQYEICASKNNNVKAKNSIYSYDEKIIQTVNSFMEQRSNDTNNYGVNTRIRSRNDSAYQSIIKPKNNRSSLFAVENPINYKSKCSAYRCQRCSGIEFVHSTDVGVRTSQSIKKGDVLTPSAHQSKVQKLMMRRSNQPTTSSITNTRLIDKDSTFIKNVILTSSKMSKPEENVYHFKPRASPYKPFIDKYTVNTEPDLKKSCGGCNIMKYDANKQCQDWNNEKPLLENNLTDKSSGSYTSVLSSSISKSSICKGNYNVTPFINKSRESSCNSSGHDRPDYLIQFPKSAAGACLEDVIKAHLGQSIDSKTFDFCLKHKFLISEVKKRLGQSSNNNLLQPAESISISIGTKEKLKAYNRNKKDIIGPCISYGSQQEFQKKSMRNGHFKRNQNPFIKDEIKNYKNDTYESLESKSNKNIQLSNKGYEFLNKIDRNSSHLTHKLNQSYITHNPYTYYNFSDNQLPEFLRDEDPRIKPKQPSFTRINYFVETLDMDEEYDRVYKTLKEAKEFSLHLLDLLDMYEKANKDFERITDKLKITQATIFSQLKWDNKIENAEKLLHQKDPMTPWSDNLNQEKITLEHIIISRSPSTTISQRLELTDFDDTFPIMNSDLDETNSFRSSYLLNTETRDKHIDKYNTQETYTYSEKACQDNFLNAQCEPSDIEKIDTQDITFEVTDSKNTFTKKNVKKKKIQKKYCRTYNICKRICFKKFNKNYNRAPTESAYHASKVLSEGQIGYNTLYNTTMKSKNVQTVKSKQERNTNRNSDDDSLKTVSSSEHVSASINESKTGIICNEIQKVNKKTSPKPVYVDKGVVNCDRPLLNNLERYIRELLNEFVLQPAVEEKENFNHSDNFFATYGNYEGQKAKFLLVRKVSDHTVLVKWSQPRELDDVQGYELLVDGRAVQKVFNPSNYMAVVTCLPHTEKILLTIRTITSVVSESGHYPATTVIYQPRVRFCRDSC